MGKKEDTGIQELINACSEVLRVSKKYTHLFDNSELINGYIGILSFWYGPDDNVGFGIKKFGNKFLFSSGIFSDEIEGLGARKTAYELKNSRFKVSAEDIKEQFYSNLEEYLGKYLARKEIKKITSSHT